MIFTVQDDRLWAIIEPRKCLHNPYPVLSTWVIFEYFQGRLDRSEEQLANRRLMEDGPS